MKIRIFTMLAVLFFSVNIIHAKEKQPLNAKKDTVTVNKSPVMEAILKAEQAEQNNQTIVYVRDTVIIQSDVFQLKNLDWTTPQGAKDSVLYLIAFLVAFFPRLNPKWDAWIKKEKSLMWVKIVTSISALVVPVLIFGKSTITVATLSEVIVIVAVLIGLLGIKPIQNLFKSK